MVAQPLLQGFYAVKGFARDGWFLDGDAIRFLDADRELQRVDGVEAEAVGSEEGGVGLDFLGPNPEHAVIDQKASDIVEGDLGHHLKKACHLEVVEGNPNYFRFSNSNEPN